MKEQTTVLLLLFFSSVSVLGQSTVDGLIGIYESKPKGFESYSVMKLDEQNRFTYNYGVGGCRGEVTGNWRIIDQKLQFENDEQFLKDSIIVYPDLSLSTWTVKRIGIQPNDGVDSGCLVEDRLHIKTTVIPAHDYTVSIIQLLSNPEKYHNRRVQVVGYLNLEFEGSAIYLHKEDFKQSILENSFWVSFSDNISMDEPKKMNNGYVLIAGTFDMESFGHMGAFGGEIKDIDRIIKWGK